MLSDSTYVHQSAQVIGDVQIGSHSSIWCNTVLRGDVNRIVIGHSTNIQDLAMCHVSHKSETKPNGSPLIIGNYVTVGHAVILHGCKIGDECLIGMGSIVMDDVVMESLDAPSGEELPPRGFDEGSSGFIAPAEDGSKVEVKVDPKSDRLQLLIATDISARGIDVSNLAYVLHYQLPDQMEYYTHRSGRTARAGKKGLSIAFVAPSELEKIESIEKEMHIRFEKQVEF